MSERGYRYGFNKRSDAKKWAEKNVGGTERKPRAGGRETGGSYRIKPSGSHGKFTSYTVYYDKPKKKSKVGGTAMQKSYTSMTGVKGRKTIGATLKDLLE